MNNAVGKKGPASIMRAYTQQVRDHSAAMERLNEQYFAALKRAETQYFDGVRRIDEALRSATAEAVQQSDSGAATPPTESQQQVA